MWIILGLEYFRKHFVQDFFPWEYEILLDIWCFIYMISHLTKYPYDFLCILCWACYMTYFCKCLALQVVLTKCYHLFCNACVQRILGTRHRKCPVCAASFGANDVKPVYIWPETVISTAFRVDSYQWRALWTRTRGVSLQRFTYVVSLGII